MSLVASFHRLTTAICLVLWAVLAAVFVVTVPAADYTSPDHLAAIAAAGTAATISAYAFLGAQAALTVGLVGVAQLLRHRAPVLGLVAVALLIVGAFTHAMNVGIMFTTNAAASTPAAQTESFAEGFAAALAATYDGPMLPLVALGMLGLVLGTVLLAAAVFRSRLGAWWIGVALLLWVVAEFGLSGMGVWASVASGGLLFAAFGGLAAVVLRSDLRDWMTASEVEAPQHDLAPTA
ncbi:hypothetical protein Xcel_1635 [Xylanimonas cellulosilytica DSM 15894]|uniref:DUF4386 family protein n=1 Tax=Xylanimonas cellulosilytica (strain DSM 15894 / JCM 12276 / CECT 5975 / KCTC 9989 / LMG 20990 / NBRC 107835 / XIL07) TaxID=446471 RepID=D1BSG6_XYLCX|nr:hypothetical protein [Xylanimonas cellulosilytica]ACZ30658.1 hypothetical protein Xcel_1635 [Xylanimonas cellulosilytica DSM 15894]